MSEECPKCGKPKLRKYGSATVSGGKKRQRKQCGGCGHVFTDSEDFIEEEES